MLEHRQRPNLDSCPTETPMTSEGHKPVAWVLHNPSRIPLQVFWISFQGFEQKMDSVRGGDNTTLDTFEGHAWRVRSPDGTLVAQARSSQEPLLLKPCKELYGGSYELHVPPALLRATTALQKLVDRTWQGDVLDSALAECRPWRFLSRETSFVGCHVLCVLKDIPGRTLRPPAAIAVFADGLWSERPSAIVPVGAVTGFDELLLLIQYELDYPKRGAHLQPPRLLLARCATATRLARAAR